MKRIMGIDYGDARTGIAVSDPMGWTAQGVSTINERNNPEKVAEKVLDFISEYKPSEIVIGLPKNMDGTEGVRAELCREFAARIGEVTGLPVTMWDERRTTVEAHNILSQHNYHGKKRKNTVDAVAASLILEGYLAFRKR